MAAKSRVAFFLEDSAQEAIIPPLFQRLAAEAGFASDYFDLQVLSARGGGSLKAFRQFLKDARKRGHIDADLLIVGSDANCKGFTARRDFVVKAAAKSPFHETVTAVPDPHVERWYLLDLPALSNAAGVKLTGTLPAYKCDKNRYKTLLRQVFAGSDVTPPLGGIEYGPDVAKTMDLYQASKQDHGLADFVEKTQAWLKRLKQQIG
ncbi:MAG: hypothetical protein A2107_09640 [Verrucomicrobia bacterium GWF2_62_7]|nr:MAG: hypothetical protein A2107_09640 [Verrucomicrobia bacterium GWF2_62_7]